MFSGTLLLFCWSSECWQFDLWFLCLFQNQLEHLLGENSEEVVWWRREGGGKVSLGSGTRATGHHWVFVSLSLCPGLRIIFLNHLLCFQVNHHPWLSRSCAPAQAVVKQPVRGASGRTAITAIVRTGGDWSTGLFSVCRDKRICMFFSLPLSSLLFSFLRYQWVEKLRQVEGKKLDGFRLVELIF